MLRVEAKEEVEEDQATSGKIKLTLYQGLPKAKKLSWIIEKATELGVSEIVPVITSRSIPKIPELKLRQKLDHWERIVKQASEQCGRKDIPLIDFPGDLFSKVHPLREGELGIVLWENGTVPLRDILQSHTHVARVHVVIGPEGGLAESEIRYLKTCGFAVVHLGQRTMRTETAPLAILAILGYHYGDIG
jgi:16S rRNA (uracil1498-N3)-methyltransferase